MRGFAVIHRWTVCGFIASASPLFAESLDFNRDIKPILSENCYFCHGPDGAERKADLRLDNFEGATKDRDGVKAVVPGEPEASELIHRVFSDDPDEMMPPPKAKLSLKREEREKLKAWIASGAEYKKHWAFVAPERTVAAGENVIDAHAKPKLPEASRSTLLRRATLDLTGLPPTPEEVTAFLNDESPNAYEKVVDRLLASPAYGERMAWEWLDAARYADSNGYQGDNERTMWPWRDWVVRAFNDNLPWDQFTIWQLAGDLLPDATLDQKLATGFCRNHPINGEGGRIAEENRVDYVMDMTETMGTVWLGLTLNCCRCHDHKFDPLTQRNYYELSAFFNQTPVSGGGGDARTPPNMSIPTEEQKMAIAEIDAQLKENQAKLDERLEQLRATQSRWEAEQLTDVKPSPWRILKPDEVKAEAQTLTVLDDKSVLAGGENPDNDAYEVVVALEVDRAMAAVRLEALKHETMTKGGLARSDSANFVLTDFTIEVGRKGKDFAQQKIASALATFEQGSHKITESFNGKKETGWAVYNGKPVEENHTAVYRLEKVSRLRAGDVLRFRLRHDSPHKNHNIGRFRISIGDDPKATPDGNTALLAALRKPLGERSDAEKKLIADEHVASDPEYKHLQKDRGNLRNQRNSKSKGSPTVMIMGDRSDLRKTFILQTGLYNKPGDEVAMGVPESLPKFGDLPKNRLGLAKWLVSKDNPLTARVTVNRIWQQLFGIGLVKTPEDFGTQGETPPMQELLDNLAVDFVESGWDVKRLLKQIVMSKVYRQSAKAGSEAYGMDPENRELGRGPRFRMPSPMLRDQALAASGLLVRKIGGSPVNPYQPAGVWEETSFGKKRYSQGKGDDLYRRSLYTFWRRIAAPTAFFDNASRAVCSVKPVRTNTPLHALYVFNDVTFVEAARVLAEKTIKAEPDLRKRVDSIFVRILARPASDEEATTLLGILEKSRGRFQANAGEAVALLNEGESKRDESLDAVDHAAWTALCLAVFNLDEAITKP